MQSSTFKQVEPRSFRGLMGFETVKNERIELALSMCCTAPLRQAAARDVECHSLPRVSFATTGLAAATDGCKVWICVPATDILANS